MVEPAPASSPVDDSLESVAAARGITICFADLDGAEGLWLPEERTVLLARGLSSRRAAEVLAHELEHVDIEDGHAALDAGVGHRHLGRARWAVAATAAASAVLLFTVRAELSGSPPVTGQPVGQSETHRSTASTAPAPSPTGAASSSARHSGSDLVAPRQRVRTETVTVTAPPPSTPPVTRSTAATPASHPGSTPVSPPASSRGGSGVTDGPTATNTPQVSSAPPTTTPPPSPTTEGTGAATLGSAPAP